MKTTSCFIFPLLTFVMFVFVPNAFTQNNSPEYVVRQIYFHPSDLGTLQDIDATLDKWVEHVQQFYADEMERHGFGRKTFKLETDAVGKTVRHYVKGKFTNEHYQSNRIGKVNEEISKQFDRSAHLIYLIFMENESINESSHQNSSQVGGAGSGGPFRGTATIVLSDFDDNAPSRLNAGVLYVIAHELGHAFGLPHDFRDDRYIMSYGEAPDQLSYCAAKWLDAHRYFNAIPNSIDQVPAIQMLEPVFVSSPNTVRLRFEITHSEKLHQAILLTNDLFYSETRSFDPITVMDCKSLNANTATIEFVTSELTPATEYVALNVIDEHGNFIGQRFPIDITALPRESKPILIPDTNLAAAIRESLGLPHGSTITQLDMLGLLRLRADKKQITNLKGLEYAHNLYALYLIENKINDFTILTGLTKLNRLVLNRNQIEDISHLRGLTSLSSLWLNENQIEDITPLSKLTKLEGLSLSDNQIEDITPLSKLTKLENLRLSNNKISDVTSLAELVNLRDLRLERNPIKNRKPLFELLQKNPDVKIYLENNREPLPVNLSHFRAEHTDAGVILNWTTESEVDNAGFYIYRSETKDGDFKVVNATIIQGAGTTGERNEYTWTDTTAKPNTVYYYRIEDVSHAGEREQLATVRLRGIVSARGKLTTSWADLKAQ